MTNGGLYLSIGSSTTWCNYESGALGIDLFPTKIANAIKSNYGKIKHLNKGIGGATSTTYLSEAYWWSRLEPDLVTIGLGMNDCVNDSIGTSTFSNNISSIIDIVKQSNPKATIILCAPANTSDPARIPYISSYRSALNNIASAKNVFYCDFSTAYTSAQISTYTTDGIHANKAGHGLLYNVLWPIVENSAATWLSSLKA